jgi:hypothetical protein
MKIMIVSDTHGRLGNFETVLQKEKPIDMLIHCGDIERDSEVLPLMVSCPLYIVSGNNDWGSALDRECVIDVGKHRILVVHGHYHSVYHGLDALVATAKTKAADVVCFGHTHVPVIKERDGVTLVNPGSLSYPRQTGRTPSYAVMKLDEAGEKMEFEIRELSLE